MARVLIVRRVSPLARLLRSVALVMLMLFSIALFADSSRRSGSAAPPRFEYRRALGFGDQGVLRLPGWTTVLALHAAADGATLVHLANLDQSGVQYDSAVAKVLSNGSLDPTFAAGAPTPGLLPLGGPSRRLFQQRDGRFIVGITRYNPNGSVDIVAPGFVGFDPVTYFETGAGQLISVQDTPIGAYGCQFVHHAADGMPGITEWINPRCERAFALPSGDGAVVVIQYSTTELNLVFINGEGRLDTSRGGGSGVVAVQAPAVFGHQLIDVAWQSDRLLLVTEAFGSGDRAVLTRVERDGTVDTSFGVDGIARIGGSPLAIDVGPDALTLHIGYTFALRSGSPYHATIVSLLPDGRVNTDVNPYGVAPGWWDIVEAGFPQFVLDGGHLDLGDGRVMIGFGPYERPGNGVTLLVVEPTPVRVPRVIDPATPLQPADRLTPPPAP